VGNATLFPADVSTVYVPVFETDSLRRNLGERLTEAVVKEIELQTNYKVVDSQSADSVLTGIIGRDQKKSLVQAPSDDPREIEVRLSCRVSWVTRRGDLIREQSVAVPADLIPVIGSGTLVPEVGMSGATGQQQAINELARQIVAMMESPW
jgi:hypothetical protein